MDNTSSPEKQLHSNMNDKASDCSWLNSLSEDNKRKNMDETHESDVNKRVCLESRFQNGK